ncbi:MAG: MarR family transcriptional regulator [Clostridia bacterium]|nr:MarR family transcriptional regulator [Clostridia bacterium]
MVSDDFFREAAETFLILTQQNRRRPLQKHVSSLTAGEKGLLWRLSEHAQGMTAGEIGREMQIGSGGVANLLNALEKKGYVQRAMSPTDRRCVVVTPSAQGRALIAEKKKEILQATTAFLTALGEEDTKTLLRLYRRVQEISDEWVRQQENQQA